MFTLRLLKAGYTKGFIHRNVISYKEGLYRMKFKRTERLILSTSVERILMKAKGGLPLPVAFFISKRVDTKLRNIFCTRKKLQGKMIQYYS